MVPISQSYSMMQIKDLNIIESCKKIWLLRCWWGHTQCCLEVVGVGRAESPESQNQGCTGASICSMIWAKFHIEEWRFYCFSNHMTSYKTPWCLYCRIQASEGPRWLVPTRVHKSCGKPMIIFVENALLSQRPEVNNQGTAFYLFCGFESHPAVFRVHATPRNHFCTFWGMLGIKAGFSVYKASALSTVLLLEP